MKEKITFKVNGMTCGHCSRAVTMALTKLKGVSNVKVDLTTKTVELEYIPDSTSLSDIKKAITDEGYEV